MGRNKCVVKFCSNASRHKFPVDPKAKDQWIKAIGIKNPISKDLMICGEHFLREDYVQQIPGSLKITHRRRLKVGAIPVPFLSQPSIHALKKKAPESGTITTITSESS